MYFQDTHVDSNIDSEFDNKPKFNIKKLLIIIIPILILVIIIFLLIFNKSRKINYYLELLGISDMVLYTGSDYKEPGFRAYDSRGTNYDNEVIISGDINTLVSGEYVITYTFRDIVKERHITIINSGNNNIYLSLNGDKIIYLKAGESYHEFGVTIIGLGSNDNSNVNIESNLDINKAGTYRIKYTYINKDNVVYTAERIVIVMDSSISLSYFPLTTTKENVTINVHITSNYFDYLILPDGNKVYKRDYAYEATENGKYEFTTYSIDGSFNSSEIEIKTIDREKPSGSCSGYFQNGTSYVNLKSSDNDKVDKIVFNNKSYTGNNIVIVGEYNSVKFSVYDMAGNSVDILCNLENKNTVLSKSSVKSLSKSNVKSSSKSNSTSGGSTTGSSTVINDYLKLYSFKASSGSNYSYWLYLPKGSGSGKSMVVFLHGDGETGNDYSNKTQKALTWGIGRDIKKGSNFNSVVLIPQARDYWSDSDVKAAFEIISNVANSSNVNKSKISITGFSKGCRAAFDLAKGHANYFSALGGVECYANSSNYTSVKIPIMAFSSTSATKDIMSKYPKILNAEYHYVSKYGTHTGLVGGSVSVYTTSIDGVNLYNWLTSK